MSFSQGPKAMPSLMDSSGNHIMGFAGYRGAGRMLNVRTPVCTAKAFSASLIMNPG